jgi:methionyl-tRNA formyltransferase
VRSSELPGLLADCGVDLVLLGQSGIVPSEVLKVPRIGTLNAHPGMLPEYRGIDCAAWAIERREFQLVGSSLHWVDAGVDTGPVVRRMPYRWRGDETLQVLGERLYDDCITLLADAAGNPEPGSADTCANSGGTQYYKMPRSLRRSAKRKLRDFLVSGRRMELNRRTL